MKKSKRKSLVRTARKVVREDIKQSLIAQLKGVAGQLGQASKKLNKKIEKGSRQLAKKLSKELKVDQLPLLETGNKTKGGEAIAPEPAASIKQDSNPSNPALPATWKQAPKAAAPSKPVTTKAKPVSQKV